MKILHLLLFLCLLSGNIYAQYNETIRTARPGQAVGPFTTGKYVFQVQSGLTYTGFDNSDFNSDGNSQDFFTIIRYGLLENFELRSAFGINNSEFNRSNDRTTEISGLSLWNVGIRYNIVNGEGYQPSFGFQTDVRLTWVGAEYQTEDIVPRMMLIHSQKLSETFGLTTNWAVRWDSEGNTIGQYVINISFPITDRLGSFVENYGNFSNGDINMRWDTGLGYLVNDDLFLDMSIGYGSNDGLTDWFIDAGISWRTKFK